LLLEDRLRQAIALAERERQRLAVMFLDIDHFKGVNDGLGHAAGDILLQHVASLIREQIRSSDTLGRMGGDEFLILLHGIRHSEICAVLARKISDALAAPLQVLSHHIHIGVSIGIAIYPDDGTDAATLMKNADTAMYEAKTAGRGTFRYFQSNMSERAARRLELDLDLRQAIQRNELSLEYQAKVSASSGAVVGYEALLRWHNQKQGFISPAQFIPVAEDTGLITQIGEWVVVETCRQIARWEAMGLGWLPVAINVSARQLSAGDLVSRVRQTTAQAAISPALLEIEVTESVLMAHPKEVVQTLHALKALGVRVAIDDFGTGYSSLAYLRHLPIDLLKIDRSFVAESELDANGLAIVKTILALGRTLGLTVVAEGVETQSQAVLLRKLGCDQLQGFLFATPVSGEQIAADLLAERAEAGAPTVT
jgi:diguanylate cyclase (GGDEF)-like protein